jgi:ribonuclease P protein component
MLKKPHRLKSAGAFKKALGQFPSHKNPYFSLFCLPYPKAGNGVFTESHVSTAQTLSKPRFGLIVSKKIDKRANRRNKIKRRLREILRHEVIPALLTENRNLGVAILLVRQGIQDASFQQLRLAVRHAFAIPEEPLF